MFESPTHPNRPRGRRHFGGPFDDFVTGSFGPGGPRGRGGRRRMRRGDTRAAILVLLGEQPANGYRLMQEIEERSDGAWRPSPGSVYPALSQLEDEGLVVSEKADGRKTFSLTDEGAEYVKANREKLGEPWKGLDAELNDAAKDFLKEIRPLMEAMRQVGAVGDEAAKKQGKAVLAEARRKLYAILAEDGAET